MCKVYVYDHEKSNTSDVHNLDEKKFDIILIGAILSIIIIVIVIFEYSWLSW